MKILVTGGAGFLGSNLCKRLVLQGFYVICLDNLYTGKRENILELEKYNNFKFVQADIIDGISLEEDFNWIFNLACPASPPAYQKDPLYTMRVNTTGVFNVCNFALKNNSHIFHTSTSEVYGNPKEIPQKEGYTGSVNPIGIRACYDEGKRCAETILFDYGRMHNLKFKVVRIFNTYGPNMSIDDGRVITNFISQALRNQPITVYGDGSQTRSFCYVDDQIDGWIAMVNTADTFTGPVNIGVPKEHTILEVANLIIALTDSKSEIQFKELPQDDPVRRLPDISLAQRELNWKPKISLEEGLKRTVGYIKQFI